MSQIVNAFTVDVEDYFQVSVFEHRVRRADWHTYPSRVVANTQRVLRLLEEYQVRATFFVLGWVAEQFPKLVREIHDQGHQVASHGFWHRLVYQQTPAEFREDIRHSKELLEQIISAPVTAYRAPSFSITKRSMWALEIVVEEGYQVDSSIFPIYHDRYGVPDAQPGIHIRHTPAGPIWEFPPSVAKFGGVKVPVGGGYFRFYPWLLTHRCLRQINKSRQQPFMFYMHPWEVDPEQPRIDKCGARSRFRHYVNLRRTEPRLTRLMKSFRLTTLSQVLDSYGAAVPPADRASEEIVLQ